MADLQGSKTHQNLKDAFAGESQANRRYLYFAKSADVEGYFDVAGLKDTLRITVGTVREVQTLLRQMEGIVREKGADA